MDDRSEWLDDPIEDEFEDEIMSEQEAVEWLYQVDGTVYRNQSARALDENQWVAVVRTPSTRGRAGRLILAFGETLAEATSTAEQQWQSLWSELSLVH